MEIDVHELAGIVTAKIREEISKLKNYQYGEVKSVISLDNGGYAARILFGGAVNETPPINCMTHYVPKAGDWVLVLYTQGDLIIFGEAPASENQVISPYTNDDLDLSLSKKVDRIDVSSGSFDFNNVNNGEPCVVYLHNNFSISFSNSPDGASGGTLYQGQGSHSRWLQQTFFSQNGGIFHRTSSDNGGTVSWGQFKQLSFSDHLHDNRYFYGIGDFRYGTDGLDANNLKENGFFHISSSTLNIPIQEWGFFWVWAHASNYVTQRWIATGSQRTFERLCLNDVWQPWKEVFYKSDLINGIAIPVHRRPLFHISENANNPYNTTSVNWVNFGRQNYDPFAYGLPTPQPGSTRKYKLYVVYSDNIAETNGVKPRIRLVLSSNNTTDVTGEIQMDSTWGALADAVSRDYYSGFFNPLATGHISLQTRICNPSGTNPNGYTVSIKQVDLIAYDVF